MGCRVQDVLVGKEEGAEEEKETEEAEQGGLMALAVAVRSSKRPVPSAHGSLSASPGLLERRELGRTGRYLAFLKGWVRSLSK